MSSLFAELANAETSMGTISLRRRREPSRQIDVYEVKLDDAYLMSSLFTTAEIELARLGLDAVRHPEADVVVGGLGLGYTARAALEHRRTSSVIVVEALAEVIDWHARLLLPEVAELSTDPRARMVHGDFFTMSASAEGFDPDAPGRRFDVILLDIDHTPRHVLAESHAGFYTRRGLASLRTHLAEDGVFALWSDDPPDQPFVDVLNDVFTEVRAHEVAFPNFLTGGQSANTVYVVS